MKSMYMCERCGSYYESWNDASNCEENHISPFDYKSSAYESWLGESVDFHPVYKRGEKTPRKVFLPFVDDENNLIIAEYEFMHVVGSEAVKNFVEEKNRKEEESKKAWENYMAQKREQKEMEDNARS